MLDTWETSSLKSEVPWGFRQKLSGVLQTYKPVFLLCPTSAVYITFWLYACTFFMHAVVGNKLFSLFGFCLHFEVKVILHVEPQEEEVDFGHSGYVLSGPFTCMDQNLILEKPFSIDFEMFAVFLH